MAETIANAEVLEKNIDAKTRDFVKSLNKETIDANTKKISQPPL